MLGKQLVCWLQVGATSAMLLVAGCGRTRQLDRAAPEPHQGEEASALPLVCRALRSDAGTVNERFAAILPHDRGGSVIYVLQGDAKRVTDYITSIGLVEVRSESCSDGYLIVLVPGMNADTANDFEHALFNQDGGSVVVREKHVLRPLPWPTAPGRREKHQDSSAP